MTDRTTADGPARTEVSTQRATGTDQSPSHAHAEDAPDEAPGTDAPDPNAADSRWMSVGDVRDVYRDQADEMERLGRINRLVTGRYRERLFGDAAGRVLDVACGMGMNREYVPEAADYVGIDVSPEMLVKADGNHPGLERGETLREMDAQDLAFPDDSFDTVISSLSTCTFPRPGLALAEMNRVCKPDGRILLLEHGRSDVGLLARFQDWRADAHYEAEGCRWNQEPLELVADSELAVRDSSTALLGIITTIEAVPTKRG